jgi:23S rRNA-/tRNA-specific pseudouridylate synthase
MHQEFKANKANWYEGRSSSEGQVYKVVECPIGHSAKSSKRMLAVKGSRYKTSGNPKKVRTFYREIGKSGNISLIEAFITKGMRHQIRLHLELAGLPIVGDDLYGVAANRFNLGKRMYLHCGRVGQIAEPIRS